jgi:hypothetical protein
MVLINGTNELQVYNLDNSQTILNRIASMYKTIPKYLYFPLGIPTIEQINTLENIEVEDLLAIITSHELDFNKLYEKIENKIEQQNLNLYLDIFLPFLSFNQTLTNASSEMVSTYLLFIGDKLKTFEPLSGNNLEDLDNVFTQNKSKVISAIEEGIEFNRKQVEKDMNFLTQLESISSGIEFTNFELEKINIDFELNLNNISMMEIFNAIQLNEYVPFACVNNYYKILKDFTPLQEWSYSLPNILSFKVLQKNTSYEPELDDYTDIFLSFSEDEITPKVLLSLSIIIGSSYVDLEELLKRFLPCLRGLGELEIINSEESSVNGVFYIPKHTMNRYIMADMIMNNPLFSTYMAIDESDKATKKKGSLYVYFHNQDIGYLTFNITEKIAIKNDANLRGKDIVDLFSIGSKYIRVKVSYAESIESITKFQELFSKLLVIYDQNFLEVKDFYEKFIPDLFKETQEKIVVKKEMTLKNLAPEIFVTGYPQKCPFKPTIIPDDEVEDAEQDGKVVMRFPKDGDVFRPRNYICNYKDAKYPGLRENPLKNKDLVPFLPCCYKKNPEEKPGSLFRHYYYDEERKEKDDKQQNFIKTNKFVQKDKYGELIGEVSKVFDVFDVNSETMYLRKGVTNTKSSLLECILVALENEIDEMNDEEIDQHLKDIREEISQNIEICNSGKQEMYDYTIPQIQEYLRDPEQYLDPRLTVSVLENFFNINIYVFNRYGFKSGTLVKPRYLQPYYKAKLNKDKRSIFIYEHLGSTSDHAKYPRCELIVKWKLGTQDDIEYIFSNKIPMVQRIENLYLRMLKSYSLNVENTFVDFPLEIRKDMKQGFDSYGKTRMLKFDYEGDEITLLLSRIPCLVMESTSNLIPTSINYSKAIELFQSFDIEIDGRTHNQLLGHIGNVNVSLPTINIPQDSEIVLIDTNPQVYPEFNLSNLNNYNKYKKLSRYIIEYSYWMFSQYLTEQEDSVINEQKIIGFIQDKIIIIPDYEYGEVSKYFSLESSLLEDGKLVVKSEETLKRLIFNLRIAIRNNSKKIESFHSKITIENFYSDLSDFDQYPFQVIVYGENSVEKWLEQTKINYDIYDCVVLNTEKPYFFKNILVGPDVYLVQNTIDLEKAKEIGLIWSKEGYNVGFNPDGLNDKLEFELFSYVNNKSIKKYRVGGIQNSNGIKILGYKIDDENLFSVLLPL